MRRCLSLGLLAAGLLAGSTQDVMAQRERSYGGWDRRSDGDSSRRSFDWSRFRGNGWDRRGSDGDDRRDDSRGGSPDWGRDRSRDWGRSGDSDGSDRRSESQSSSPSSSRTAATTNAAAQPLVKRERVTLSLPEKFFAGDGDRDGQIGLYEWKVWKGRAALAEFRTLDRNGDGFLTPRELAAAEKAIAIATTTAPATTAPAAAPTPTAPPAASPAPPAASTAATPAAPMAPAANEAETRVAQDRFKLLDENHDGRLSADEWKRSTKIRALFEQAKLDLSQPMPETDFVAHYTRLSAATGL